MVKVLLVFPNTFYEYNASSHPTHSIKMMNKTIPKIIRPLLDEYLSLTGQQLPNLLSAFYLEGSIALGGFNERLSDIDFIALLQHKPTSAETDTLRSIHAQVEKSWPRWKMSGSYLTADYVSHLHYHDGVLTPGGPFVVNSVEGWILKNHGIALLGAAPQSLPITVDWNVILRDMKQNLNTYWASYTNQPRRMLVLLSDWGIQWAVLGVLRQFYSFREGSIVTKTQAGEYGLRHVPAEWHGLIREAIQIREEGKGSGYVRRIGRMVHTINFLKFVIEHCADV